MRVASSWPTVRARDTCLKYSGSTPGSRCSQPRKENRRTRGRPGNGASDDLSHHDASDFPRTLLEGCDTAQPDHVDALQVTSVVELLNDCTHTKCKRVLRTAQFFLPSCRMGLLLESGNPTPGPLSDLNPVLSESDNEHARISEFSFAPLPPEHGANKFNVFQITAGRTPTSHRLAAHGHWWGLEGFGDRFRGLGVSTVDHRVPARPPRILQDCCEWHFASPMF